MGPTEGCKRPLSPASSVAQGCGRILTLYLAVFQLDVWEKLQPVGAHLAYAVMAFACMINNAGGWIIALEDGKC